VAHLHACRNLPGAIAARSLQTTRVPYVLAPNGTAPNVERRRLAKRAFDGLFGARVMAHASRVVAVTQAERLQLIALGVAAERIAVVPNPIAVDEFEPPIARGRWRQRLGIQGPLVAYLGTLMPRKRVEILIRACAGLPAETTFVVAGNDLGSEAAIRGVVRDVGVHGRTRFTGLITGRARLDLLADADVVVYPSRHEVFGLVPLEALLAGTPVVVANDSGCGEIVAAMGGGLVVPGEPDALRSAVAHILEAPAHWRAAATQAARRVRAAYATDVVCAQLEQVYREIVGAR
jgi:glycosyltransferase involved in cell wall biosynthesis